MNKIQAKLMLYPELGRQTGACFEFACMENGEITEAAPSVDMWHLTFCVGAPLGEIQLTLEFQDEYVDVLAFPHPRIIDEKCALDMVRFVNWLNGNVKLHGSNGRFYVDENDLDVAYSARLSYKYLELLPQEAVSHGVLGFLGFVAAAAVSLYQIGKGDMTAEDGCQYMVELWGA